MSRNGTQVITGRCRLSYEHIWKMHASQPSATPQYSACILIPKTSTNCLREIKEAIEEAIKDGITSKWGGKRPPMLKIPLRDGDQEHPDDPAFRGMMFMNANAKEQQPQIGDLSGRRITDFSEVYSGCYCAFGLKFYPYDNSGSKGVGCGLNHVIKLEDGEPFTGVTSLEQAVKDWQDPDGIPVAAPVTYDDIY